MVLRRPRIRSDESTISIGGNPFIVGILSPTVHPAGANSFEFLGKRSLLITTTVLQTGLLPHPFDNLAPLQRG